jgi:L(+)-tartrate dehydratase beta subunit
MAHYDFHMPVSEAQVRALKVNDTVTLHDTLYGIRDATQIHMFDRGRTTKFDLRGHAVVHTAPNVRWVGETAAAPVGYEPVCVGTTTSDRQGSLDAFRDLGGVYLAVIGGAAALETTWIEQIEDVDLHDLNPESLWKFRIRGFGPLLVSMDSHGSSLYTEVNAQARDRRAAVLAALGVKS